MTPLRTAVAALISAGGLVACAGTKRPVAAPAPDTTRARVITETVTVRDREVEQRLSRLELRLLERDAQVEELQTRLDETRREAVRSMAKVQTLSTRAEAASGMAEAEIALQALRRSAGGQPPPEIARAARLLEDASKEFNRQNYGGALWLANQAKSLASVGRSRFSSGDPGALRPGEVMFAVPVRLQTVGRCNVREGPGTGFRSLALLEGGASLTSYSYVEQWMRVTDDTGRMGWVFYNLVRKRQETAR